MTNLVLCTLLSYYIHVPLWVFLVMLNVPKITLTEYNVKRGEVSVQVSVCSETYHRCQGINLTIYINNHLSVSMIVFLILFNTFNP